MKNFTIERVDLSKQDDEAYQQIADHFNRMREESAPEDPPTPMSTLKHRFENLPDFVNLGFWLARRKGADEVIASGSSMVMNTGQNEHICQIDVRVEPDFRCQGLGTSLLRRTVRFADEEGRTLLLFSTNGRVPAGAAFLEQLGAQKALETSVNQLDLADVDKGMIRQWVIQGEKRAVGIELGLWEGPYPDDQLDRVVALMEVMDSQPTDDLDVEEMKFNAEQIRSLEKNVFSDGVERWTLYARDAASDQMTGFTELYYNPNNPKVLEQGNTGVFPEYRGRGIGKWLKAAMIEKVFAERPEAQFIRTGNADSNAPMLKINHQLGFKQLKANASWQIPIEDAQAKLV